MFSPNQLHSYYLSNPSSTHFQKDTLRPPHPPSKDTPIKKIQLDKEELRRRRALASLLQEAGVKLNLPQTTISCALSIFHKLFSINNTITLTDPKTKSPQEEQILFLQTLLYLSSKIMETPTKIRDVLNVFYRITKKKVLELGDEYSNLKTLVFDKEQELLRLVGFKFVEDDLPYKYLFNYLYSLKANNLIAQTASNILNDTFLTPISLSYGPNAVAVGVIYLAVEFIRSEDGGDKWAVNGSRGDWGASLIPDFVMRHKNWWVVFGINSLTEIEEILEILVELYQDRFDWRKYLGI